MKTCRGCGATIAGCHLKFGKRGLCWHCELAYRCFYDPDNKAMVMVLQALKAGEVPRSGQFPLERLWPAYSRATRQLTKINVRKHIDVINPDRRPIGQRAWCIDHITPVKACFDFGVEPEDAAAVVNLQCVPELVNALRGSYLRPADIVGVPPELMP